MRMIISPLLRQALSFAQQEFFIVVLNFFHLLLCMWVFYAYAKKYVFLCVCLCVYMVCVHHVHALPSEARGGHLIPCIWSCELPVEAENQTQILCKSGQCS